MGMALSKLWISHTNAPQKIYKSADKDVIRLKWCNFQQERDHSKHKRLKEIPQNINRSLRNMEEKNVQIRRDWLN